MRPVAVITGATSGIGRAYAYTLAKQGYDLILTGRREEILKETSQVLGKQYGCAVKICIVDFSIERSFAKFLDWISTQERVSLLINNAGYGLEESFINGTYDNQYNMIKVHIHASVALAHAIGQKMKKQRYGGIINVCSLAAYIPLPTSAMYASTKSFLVTFSECLAMELQQYDVKVQALCPGFVHTDFHSRLRHNPFDVASVGRVAFMNAEDVVAKSLQVLESRKQVIVVPGCGNQIGYFILRHIPKQVYYMVVQTLTQKWHHKTYEKL